MAVHSTGAAKPKMPPKSRNSTLVAFEAEASKVAVPDSVAPLEGMRTRVVGGFLTVMLTPGLNALPDALKASDTRT